MVVHASLQMGLDLAPGKAFSEEVRRRFFSMVHPTYNSSHITMVVAFGWSSFKLDEDSDAVALESITGGHCDALEVSILKDRVFSFTVASKKVGFSPTTRENLSLPSSLAIFIYGIMGVQTSIMNSISGKSNVTWSGLWFAPPNAMRNSDCMLCGLLPRSLPSVVVLQNQNH